MKILYFSGTGNSLYIAKTIGGQTLSIPKLIKNEIYEVEDDVVGIVVPCYYMTIPRIVKNYLKKLKIKSNYVFCIVNYGSHSFSAIKHLENLINHKVNYSNDILMVENYLPMFNMDKILKSFDYEKMNTKLNQIKTDIENRKNKRITKFPHSYIISYFGSQSLKKFQDDIDKHIKINNNCNKCKICESLCPVGNIKIDNNHELLHKCEYCMSCIQHCPKGAIHLDNEKSESRYHNPNIKLSEMKINEV